MTSANSSLSQILIKRIRVACKVRDENIEEPVAVVVANGDAHAGLSASRLVQSGSGEHAHFGERSIVIVVEQQIGIAVVGDVNVRPAIVIEVAEHDTETVIVGILDAGGLS